MLNGRVGNYLGCLFCNASKKIYRGAIRTSRICGNNRSLVPAVGIKYCKSQCRFFSSTSAHVNFSFCFF